MQFLPTRVISWGTNLRPANEKLRDHFLSVVSFSEKLGIWNYLVRDKAPWLAKRSKLRKKWNFFYEKLALRYFLSYICTLNR